MRWSEKRGMKWIAIPTAAALLGWGGAALAAGGTTDVSMATTVVVTSAVTAAITYSSGSSLLFNEGAAPSGTTTPCVAGGSSCMPSNIATLSLQAPGASDFTISAYDTGYVGTSNQNDTIPGSALGFTPGLGAFSDSGVQLTTSASSPVNLFSPALGLSNFAVANSPAVLIGGGQVGGEIPGAAPGQPGGGGPWLMAGVVIPANTPADTYTNTVTFIVQAS